MCGGVEIGKNRQYHHHHHRHQRMVGECRDIMIGLLIMEARDIMLTDCHGMMSWVTEARDIMLTDHKNYE